MARPGRRSRVTTGIGKVAFTGETTTGQEIMRLAAGNVKKISLELGGKSPNIVFADADLEKFARESPYSVFDNCGQDCCARSRILVERSAHERVVELFAEATRKVKVGDPADDATEVGTLVSFRQRDRVRDYIEIGLGEGATIVVGGDAPADPALADGAYLMPTVFDGVSNDMRIAREEIFGPVVSIIPFDTEEEALRLANATPYGLSGSIWSRDIGKALRAARALQAGVISVNSNSSVHTEAPFGGYKMSRHRPRARDVRARAVHRDEERLHRPELIGGGSRSGRRRTSQSWSAQSVVLNAMPAHGIASGGYATTSVASGVGAAVPPTMRASKAMVTTDASSRVYSPTISPGSTMSPVSSHVSRTAAWLTVSSTSRKPPGCAHVPRPGSMPRRMSTISPASVMGRVVTTSRGLTYAT